MKLAVILSAVLILGGCASKPRTSRLASDQYCFTNQTIDVADGTKVSSQTQIKCTDDPIEKYVPVRMGIAKDCSRHYISMNLNGRLVKEEIIACQKFDGVLDVIDSRTVR